MNDLTLSLAVRLCKADIICGFISVVPVLDSREAIIRQRLLWYRKWLHLLVNEISAKAEIPAEIFYHRLLSAVELTVADMICSSIAVEPVLYDRDERIRENIVLYFSCLQNCAVPSEEDNADNPPLGLNVFQAEKN